MSSALVPLIERTRLRVPREQMGVLVEPAANAIVGSLRMGVSDDGELLPGLSFKQARNELRAELRLTGPVVLAGHQVEFFHAGVFAKNLAAAVLAQRIGGRAVFLAVDSDVPKTSRLTVPQITGRGLRPVEVELPGVDVRLPAECQSPMPREEWLSFFTRVASLHEHYDRSLLREFADAWLAHGEVEERVGFCAAMARGREATERALGLSPLKELRVSSLCATPSFRSFTGRILSQAADFSAAYNSAQGAYRRRHRVRNRQRPVPPLVTLSDVVEAPFWIERVGCARQRLFVRVAGESLEMMAGMQAAGAMPLGALRDSDTHSKPWSIEQAGWRIRPRALTLSAFSRLVTADLFVHGIGGAKYDEVTDEFVQSFFGARPAPLCCVTATVHLPLPAPDVRIADLYAARRRTRDVRFNPQRYLESPPENLVRKREALIAASDALRASGAPREERRPVFDGIRRLNRLLLETNPEIVWELERRVDEVREQLEQFAIARDREYFYALHTRHAMERLLAAVSAELKA